jgi:hypothetical protein
MTRGCPVASVQDKKKKLEKKKNKNKTKQTKQNTKINGKKKCPTHFSERRVSRSARAALPRRLSAAGLSVLTLVRFPLSS